MSSALSPQPAYRRDPYLKTLEVEVLSIGQDGDRRFAVLDDSVLYPEGGGQPADRGRLGDTRVLDVQKSDDGPRHYFDGELDPGKAHLELDWSRRFDHMQQHSAQHLLTAIAADRFGWPTTSFHLSAEVCDIELDAELDTKDLQRLEEAVASEIRAARHITSRFVAPEDLATLGVRSRGLPEGHRGDVRLVEIDGIDLAACGGTHLRSTAEIEAVKLLATEPLRGGLRLTWIAGGRVRSRLGAHETRAAELRRVLGAGDDELAAVAGAKLEQLKRLGRQSRRQQAQIAELTADQLKQSQEPLIERHFEDVDLGFLSQLARSICGEESDKTVFLTAKDSRGAYLLLAAGGEAKIDVQATGREIAPLLEGRGGGSGRFFQGRAGSLEKRDQALARIR